MYKGQIAIDGDALDLTGYAAGLLDVAHDSIEPIREKRVVLDVRPGNQTRQQVRLPLIEDLIVDGVERALDDISCHDVVLWLSMSPLKQALGR
jgi:hypothetical protein